MNRLAENIKLIRKQKWKLSQDRFAALLGSSRSKINSYENSGVEPSISFMVKLQQLCGIPVANIYKFTINLDKLPPEPMNDGPLTNIEQLDHHPIDPRKMLSSYEDHIASRLAEIEDRLRLVEEKFRNG